MLLAALLFVSLLWENEYLVVEHNGNLLSAWTINEGERFEVDFMHSLNLSPIVDVFEWTSEGMVLRESLFQTLGGGTPTPADFPGSELVHLDGGFKLTGIDLPFSAFAILTQEIPNHRISFAGRELFLLDLVGPGESVTIDVRRMSIATRLILFLSGG